MMSREKKNSRRYKLVRNALIMNLRFVEKFSLETVAVEVGLSQQHTKVIVKTLQEEGITDQSINELERKLNQ
jgi:ferritin-like metal-binding protein YciE